MFSKSARYFYDSDAVRQPAALATLKDGRTPRSNPPGWSGNPRVVEAESRSMAAGATSANLRNFWLLGPEPFRGAHYAGYPTELPKRCILAGSRPGDTVLDPFVGSGTTALVAHRLGREAVGIELSPEYAEMARQRIEDDAGPMLEQSVTVQAVQADMFEQASEVAG